MTPAPARFALPDAADEGLAKRPGYGLGECPTPIKRFGWVCGCFSSCEICGHAKHTAVHMHALGGKPGDPPFDHEFLPRRPERARRTA